MTKFFLKCIVPGKNYFFSLISSFLTLFAFLCLHQSQKFFPSYCREIEQTCYTMLHDTISNILNQPTVDLFNAVRTFPQKKRKEKKKEKKKRLGKSFKAIHYLSQFNFTLNKEFWSS